MQEPFIMFSAPHLAALAAGGMAIALIIWFRSALRVPGWNRIMRYGLAGVLAASELSLYTWYTVQGAWGWYALPFQLCTIMVWASIYVLLTKNKKAYEVTFFLGILGAMQAMLTPYLTVGYPDFRYFHFFIAHIAIIGASVFMTAVEGFRPTWKSVIRALLWLNLLAIPAAIANVVRATISCSWPGNRQPDPCWICWRPGRGTLFNLRRWPH